MTEFFLKPAYGVIRPDNIFSDFSDKLLAGRELYIGDKDVPSGYTFRQSLIFLGPLFVYFALRSIYADSRLSNYFLYLRYFSNIAIGVVAFLSVWIPFSRVVTGHHSWIGVSVAMVWVVVTFWLLLLILPTRRHLALDQWHIGGMATWAFFLLLILASQGERALGGLLVALVVGMTWGLAYQMNISLDK